MSKDCLHNSELIKLKDSLFYVSLVKTYERSP